MPLTTVTGTNGQVLQQDTSPQEFLSGEGQYLMPVTQTQGTQAIGASQNQLSGLQNLVNALQQQGGIQNQSQVYNQQQALAQQLGAMAQGQGPNPALAQLNQTTGQNVAQQAALMAGQRGAGTNAGLIAREAAQQGAATQQGAVGQAATLRAQQQLGAISALQQQQGMLGNLATTQAGQQIQGQQALTQLTQAQQQQLLGAINQQNTTQLGATGLGLQQQSINNQVLGSILGGIGAAGSAVIPGLSAAAAPASLAEGGNIMQEPHYAGGGNVQQQGSAAILKENYKGAKSKVGKHLLSQYAKGGKVEAMVSPGEIYLPPKKLAEVLKGKASPLSGKEISGKPKVGGAKNDYANDTVHKTLKEGGMILPRSITKADGDKEAKARQFIANELSKKSRKK